jgi:hypothetical protein
MKSKAFLAALIACSAVMAFGGPPAPAGRAAAQAPAQGPSPAEARRRAKREQRWLRTLVPTPACPLPPVRETERLIAFGAYHGESIASTAVAGPSETTYLIDVVIEPGRQPLYLVLTSYESMVWRFSGATGRVRQVVISSFHEIDRSKTPQAAQRLPRLDFQKPTPAQAWRRVSASGAVGLPARKVVIAPSHCPKFFYEPQVAGDSFSTARGALGRDPDSIFGSYSTQRVRLPSGIVTKDRPGTAPRPPGFDPEKWSDAARYWVGGLVYLSPSEVVAGAPVSLYQVLPADMGLSQLVGAGALEPLDGDRFRLLRPIPHLPPGMAGAHSITLLLAEGVPPPPGDPAHSCVLHERDQPLFKRGGDCPRAE